MTVPSQGEIQTSGPLFELVQLARLYPDSKRFPDSRLVKPVEQLWELVEVCLNEWKHAQKRGATNSGSTLDEALRAARGLDELATRLRRVIDSCFDPPEIATYVGPLKAKDMDDHIEQMWKILTREPLVPEDGSTLLRLPHRYVVPGGRYIEFYYWDSYFTSLGLAASGRHELLAGLVENMAHLIREHECVPNGTRTYFLSRSQTPFFALMLGLLAAVGNGGEAEARAYVPELLREHAFWNTGKRVIHPGGEPDEVLNRYWDDCDSARPEGFREDRTTWYEARDAGIRDDEGGVYRDLRAAAESGWDFSTRWLAPGPDGRWELSRIRTTSVVPIDLNCMIFAMESRLAAWLSGAQAESFAQKAARRGERLRRFPFWDEEIGWFRDALIGPEGLTPLPTESLAGLYPLFCGVADTEQAARVADRVRDVYLKAGGVVTSPESFESGQQWDFPNGWAPLQWVTVAGLFRHGFHDLAREIAAAFVGNVEAVYNRTGAMMEKFDVCHPDRSGGGGEYANQQGFGWTNGVVRAFQEFLRSPRGTTPKLLDGTPDNTGPI